MNRIRVCQQNTLVSACDQSNSRLSVSRESEGGFPPFFTVLPLHYGVPDQLFDRIRGQRLQALENVATAGTYIAQFAR